MKNNIFLLSILGFVLLGAFAFTVSTSAATCANYPNRCGTINGLTCRCSTGKTCVNTNCVTTPTASLPTPASSCASPRCSYGGVCYDEGRTFSGYTCTGGNIVPIQASPVSASTCASPKCFWNNGCYSNGAIVSVGGNTYTCSNGNISQAQTPSGSCSAPNCRYGDSTCALNNSNTIYGGLCYLCSNTAINSVPMSNCTGGGGAGTVVPGTPATPPGTNPADPHICSYISSVLTWSPCVSNLSRAVTVIHATSSNSAVCVNVPTVKTCSNPGPDPDPVDPPGRGGNGGGPGTGGTGTDGVCGSSGRSAIELFYSIPTTDLCDYTSVTPTTVSGDGSVPDPWTWDCVGRGSGTVSPSCRAYLNTEDPNPALSCAQLSIAPSSTINVNTNAVFTFSPNSPNIYWKTSDDADFAPRTNPLNKIFTTIGQKTVMAKVGSTTNGRPNGIYGRDCTVNINVVQNGGGTNEF